MKFRKYPWWWSKERKRVVVERRTRAYYFDLALARRAPLMRDAIMGPWERGER